MVGSINSKKEAIIKKTYKRNGIEEKRETYNT